MRSAPRLLLTATVVAAASFAVTSSASADTTAGSTGVVTATSPAPNGVAGRVDTYTLTSDGVARSYRLFVPPVLPTTPARLVVMLHPLNNTAATMESATNLDAGAAANRALVAYPSGIGNSWNAGTCCGTAQLSSVDDVSFLDRVMDDVESHYSVDPAKVAMGGFSNGGLMSYRYACERSARVRVFAIGSGVPVEPSCQISRPVAILHMHGLADTVVPWLGTTTSLIPVDGIFPSVPGAVSGVAVKDGCTGWTAPSVVSTGATRRQATGCPTGASVDMFTSPNLIHAWSTGAAAATYHLDETGLTWSFILGH